MRERNCPSNREPYPSGEQAPIMFVTTCVEKEVDGITFQVPIQQKVTFPQPDPNVGITVDDFDPIALSKAGYNVKSGIVDRGFADVESALERIN